MKYVVILAVLAVGVVLGVWLTFFLVFQNEQVAARYVDDGNEGVTFA